MSIDEVLVEAAAKEDKDTAASARASARGRIRGAIGIRRRGCW